MKPKSKDRKEYKEKLLDGRFWRNLTAPLSPYSSASGKLKYFIKTVFAYKQTWRGLPPGKHTRALVAFLTNKIPSEKERNATRGIVSRRETPSYTPPSLLFKRYLSALCYKILGTGVLRGWHWGTGTQAVNRPVPFLKILAHQSEILAHQQLEMRSSFRLFSHLAWFRCRKQCVGHGNFGLLCVCAFCLVERGGLCRKCAECRLNVGVGWWVVDFERGGKVCGVMEILVFFAFVLFVWLKSRKRCGFCRKLCRM
eukprot:g81229.t1